jgi:hypothetical protein
MRLWISDEEMQKYHDAVSMRCGDYQIWDGISLDNMTNEEYKKGILDCYRKALNDIPMPNETPVKGLVG